MYNTAIADRDTTLLITVINFFLFLKWSIGTFTYERFPKEV